MKIFDLKLVLDVAHRGSFAATARAWNIDPSVVSRTVAQIEAHYGARLFHRTTRRLTATDAGLAYLHRISAAMDEITEAGTAFAGAAAVPSGTIRVSASVAYGQTRIIPMLAAWRQTLPDVTIDLVLTDRMVDLVAERIDLAIRLAPDITGDVIRVRLHPTRYRVVAAPAYLAQAPTLQTPQDLVNHGCLRVLLPGHADVWRLKGPSGRTHTLAVDGPVGVSNPLALAHAVRAGLGPALLADWLIADGLADGTLVDVFPDYEATATTFNTAAWLVYPNRRFLPAAVRASIDILRSHLVPTPADARKWAE